MPTTTVSLRLDTDLKHQAEDLFTSLGLNMSTAVSMFIRQAVHDQAIPFRVARRPNAVSQAALREVRQILAGETDSPVFDDVESLMADLRA